MNRLDNIHSTFVGHLSFPFMSYLMNRKQIMSRFRALKKSEFYLTEQIRDIQFEKLKSVIRYANKYVPFYQKRFNQISFKVEDLKTIDDLKHIPPLERAEVIEYHEQLVDVRFAPSIEHANRSQRGPGVPDPLAGLKRHKLVRNTSSGSTGAPTIFYEDGSQTAVNWVHELRLRHWFGISPGAPEARMVRVSNEFVSGNRTNRLRKLLWNQLILPGVNLNEENYAYAVKELQIFKPKVLWGFTAALAGLAKFIDEQDISAESFAPQLIITWAAPLYDHENEILKKVFNCYVTNIYGMREIGHIAMQCSDHRFHINHENMLLESVSSRENPEGVEAKELLGTPLEICPMPFIRYRTGDLGEVSSTDCSCGKTLAEIKNFVGRTGEVFFSKDGRMISPNFWCRLFMTESLSGAINRFQVKYKKNKDIDLFIEKGTGYDQNIEETLHNKFYKSFSDKTKLSFIYVDKIKPKTSGKYLMVYHENGDRH